MKNTLFNKTINGLKWTSISTLGSIVLQISYTSIMSRLLTPSDFGLVALATSVVNFGNYFASLGLGRALVQKETLAQEDIRAVFSISLMMGLLISKPIIKLIENTALMSSCASVSFCTKALPKPSEAK